MPQNQARWAPNWADKTILFVSGKGGVGKSLVAAGIAHQEAKAGKRVLLAEIGDNSYYKDFWNLPSVGHVPVRLKQGFDLALWNGESCLREYVVYFLRMEKLYSLFFENKVMRSLINVAPGLSEIAITGKITSGIRKVGPPLEYDLIVVDCYATGHALALFQAPKGLMEAMPFGPMGSNSRDIDRVLRDPSLCSYLAVTLLEEMPVVETVEFRNQLRQNLGVDTAVVANKVLETGVDADELAKLEKADPEGLGEFARYLRTISSRQTELMETLTKETKGFGIVPLIFSSEPDALVAQTGEALRRA